VNKIIFLFIILVFTTECSFNKNSKFWTSSKNINKDTKLTKKKIILKERATINELNPNLRIIFNSGISKVNPKSKYHNNYGRINFDKILKKSSRFKFSKIKNFYQFEPVISSYKDNIIFFDNKGSILRFNSNSNLVWKKNYYTKSEKKLKPILQFSNNGKYLIVADNITKYYMLDLETGNLVWSKNNLAPFNSQIKIFKDKFFIIDFSNILRCFSIKDGEELWNVKTEDSLIKSQKKLSMIITDNKLIFNNSIGDISAVNLNSGVLLWQLPTQSSSIFESSFSLETSEIITDGKVLYFSNNKNQLFAINIDTASFSWENKINSNLRSSLVENYLFSISLEGFLFVTDVNSGNIIKITDIFNDFKLKNRSKIKPTGFILGSNKIYVSTNNGKLLIVDTITGKTTSILKIDNEKISQPFIVDKNLFVIKDNAIIRLN
jgi:outer membrane protein assembly factor BamB